MQAYLPAALHTGLEILPGQHLLHGHAGIKPQHFLIRHLAEPVPIVHDLRFVTVQNLERLLGICLRILQHLFTGKGGAGHGTAGRIADRGGEIPDEQNSLVAKFLELAQFLNSHGMAQMDVWSSRVHTQLHAQGAAQLEALLQLFAADHDGGTAHQYV